MTQMLRALAVPTVLIIAALHFAPSLGAAQPHTLRVPKDFPTIQDAVNAAAPGDQVRVGPGQWCGATINKRLDLLGEGGATIVGCSAPAPALFSLLRIGFFLPNSGASGTTVRHFVFDGRGISNGNLSPLSFAVFARDASNVVVGQNRVLGTIQAITNTRGSGWTVSYNVIEGLTALTCEGFCGGGDGIVFQARPFGAPRGTDNTVIFNVITGAVPDTLNEFSMTGIFVLGQDGTVIKNNRIAIPDNPLAAGAGIGILVTDVCCGLAGGFLTSINSTIVNNDGRASEFAVVIDRDAGGGTGNSVGTILRGNFGVNDINGSSSTVKNRSIKTLEEF